MSVLAISGAEVRMDDDGRYCLNDLHKAAGGLPKHQPAFFMRRKETSALMKEMANSADSQSLAMNVVEGRHGGTYVAKELVYAYAMWISPKFHLRVIRAYDALVKAELDRLNGLHFRAVRAELEFLHGMQEASACGVHLRKWRDDKRDLSERLRSLEIELQPELPLAPAMLS